MMLDRVDMTATMSGPLGPMAAAATYFEREELPAGQARVREIRSGAQYGEFFLSDKNILIGRADTYLVLDEEFGRIYATVDADYATGRERVRLNTRPFPRTALHQPPSAGKGPKAGFPESFALVRVFKTPPNLLVAVADYSFDGTLMGFHVATSSGEWTGQPDFYAPRLDAAAAARAGIPAAIDPFAFVADPFKGLPKTEYAVDRTAALIYRDHATSVERLVQRGSRVDRATLWFPPSATKQPLLKLERKYPFATGP